MRPSKRLRCRFLLLLTVCLGFPGSARPDPFLRGDPNEDGSVTVSDAISMLGYLFGGGRPIRCVDSADANDSGTIDLSDPVGILTFLFLGGPPPLPPFPHPGCDPTADAFGCGDCAAGPLAAPTDFTASITASHVMLRWKNRGAYDAIQVRRAGAVIASLAGAQTSLEDLPGGCFDEVSYTLTAVAGAQSASTPVLRIAGLGDNLPPAITVMSPAAGSLLPTTTVNLRLRVDDEGSIARIVVNGLDILAQPGAAPIQLTRSIELPRGLSLIRIEAVDVLGRASFVEVPVGVAPILSRDVRTPTPGLGFQISSSGYDELEGIINAHQRVIEEEISRALAGSTLLRATGPMTAIVGDAASFDSVDVTLTARSDHLGWRVGFDGLKVEAHGSVEVNLLGHELAHVPFDVTLKAASGSISGRLRFEPNSNRSGVEGTSTDIRFDLNGFAMDVEADGAAGLAADVIEKAAELVAGFLPQLRDAVDGWVVDAAAPGIGKSIGDALEKTLGKVSLPRVDVEPEGSPVSLEATGSIAAIGESLQGLNVQINTRFRAEAEQPAPLPYPGSTPLPSAFPSLPLSFRPEHPVDLTAAISRAALHQAVTELVRTGTLGAKIAPAQVGAPPLTVSSLSSQLVTSFACLAGIEPGAAIEGRIELRQPPVIELGTPGEVDRSALLHFSEVIVTLSAGEQDLLGFSLSFTAGASFAIRGNRLQLVIGSADGRDADHLPDAIVDGLSGVEIGLAFEAYDLAEGPLLSFAHSVLARLGDSLGDLLQGFSRWSIPLPGLAFDTDGSGANDTGLFAAAATFVPVATGGSESDWLCALIDLERRGLTGTIGREVDARDWSANWTTTRFFSTAEGTFLFLLRKSDGDVKTIRMEAGGRVGETVYESSFLDDGWTTAEPFTLGSRQLVFLLKESNGLARVFRLRADGSMDEDAVWAENWTGGWTAARIYRVAGRSYLFILKESSGLARVHELDAAGRVGALVRSYDWSAGWTNVHVYASGDSTYLLLQKVSNGLVHVHRIEEDGTPAEAYWTNAEQTLGDGWTHLLPYSVGGEGFFLRYRPYWAQSSFVGDIPDGRVVVSQRRAQGVPGVDVVTTRWIPEQPVFGGWTNIEAFEVDGASYLFRLRGADGAVVIDQLNE